MNWNKAKLELLNNGVPMAAIGYCKIAFDMAIQKGRRDGETSFICFMIDHYEGSEVTEEMLQRAYSDYLKAIRTVTQPKK